MTMVGAWNRSAAPSATVVGGDPSEHLAAWAPDVALVAVSDDAVPGFLATLAAPAGTVLLHTSGSLPLSALPPAPGAHVGGWHPLQSFGASAQGDVPVPPYWVALDGDDRAVAAGRSLAEATGHPSVVVRGEAKAAYHAAAVLASNAFTALEAAAVEVMVSAGVPRDASWPLLQPLVHGTLNNLADGDFRRAITGPVARGDATTVIRNLAAASTVPGAAAIYRALSAGALRLVEEDLGDDVAAAVRSALKPPDGQV